MCMKSWNLVQVTMLLNCLLILQPNPTYCVTLALLKIFVSNIIKPSKFSGRDVHISTLVGLGPGVPDPSPYWSKQASFFLRHANGDAMSL